MRSGVFWSAPLSWYAMWAEGVVRERGGAAGLPLCLVCSDGSEEQRAALAAVLAGAGLQAVDVRRACADGGDAGAWEALRDAVLPAGGAALSVADWLCLAYVADAGLLVSNSTFSMSAALANGDIPSGRFFRPDPAAAGGAGAIVAFDPWDAKLLLKADAD